MTAKARIAATGLFSRMRNARRLTASILDTSVQAKWSGGTNGKPVDELTLIPVTSTLNRARGQLALRPPRSSGSLTPPTDVHRARGRSLRSTRGLNFCAKGCQFCQDGRNTSHTRRAQARAIAAKRTIQGPWLRPIQIASKAKKGAEIHAQAAGLCSHAEALSIGVAKSTYHPGAKASFGPPNARGRLGRRPRRCWGSRYGNYGQPHQSISNRQHNHEGPVSAPSGVVIKRITCKCRAAL